MPLGNQSVLLAGVNDCVHIQRRWCTSWSRIRVRPYYLYQCDLVEGAGHFRTPVGKGLEIMEGLRGHTTGYAVPTYVIDAPGGGGKIPVMPNYLISHSDDKVVLRNYEGYITAYEEPTEYKVHDRSACSYCREQRAEPGQSGIHGLLQGDRMWIEPRGFEEIHSRGNVEQHRLQDAAKWVPYGVGAIEGSARGSLPVLEPGSSFVASGSPAPAAPRRLHQPNGTGRARSLAHPKVRPRPPPTESSSSALVTGRPHLDPWRLTASTRLMEPVS